MYVCTLEEFILVDVVTLLYKLELERSQNTVLLASTQAVYKAPHSTVWGHYNIHTDSHTSSRQSVVIAVGSLRA